MPTMKRLYVFLGAYKWHFALGIFSVMVTTVLGLLIPMIFRALVDGVLVRGSEAEATRELVRIISLFLGLSLLRWIFLYINTLAVSYAGHGTVRSLRAHVYRHLMNLSMNFYEMRATGDTISRVTNDISNIQTGITQSIGDFAYSLLSVVGVVGFIFYLNWKLAVITVFVIPLAGVLVGFVGNRIRDIGRRIQAELGHLSTILQETLTSISVVKAFTMEEHEINRFNLRNKANMEASVSGARLLAFLFPAVEMVLAVGVLLVMSVGGRLVITGEMTVGDLVAFLTYLGMASTPATTLTRTYTTVQGALAAADRVFEVLDYDVKVTDERDAIGIDSCLGKVEFRNVSFGYSYDQMVLEDISLMVEPGEVIALVGPSGAGKTSLVNLIARFYDVVRGSILLDGKDIRGITINSLRKQVGIVPQDSILFSTSIRENIAYGTANTGLAEIREAAKAANAHDFITALPDGYDTVVGERGATLSGGQKQRVSIARALLRNPRILILDEATSALDTESEILVKEALERLMKGRTTFIIAHRLSTIRHADRIIVLEAGRITEMGTHDGLLRAEGTYSRLYTGQIEGFWDPQ